jgi:phosphoribosylanthranilate isomerase
MRELHPDGWLIDSKVSGMHGGSGKTFDWNLLSDIPRSKPLVLSGGLNPENVAVAIRTVAPDWVDVASGVESAPGIKDEVLIQRFVSAARAN